MTDIQKLVLLRTLPVGTLLEMRGYIVMLLGFHEEEPYVIHQIYHFLPQGAQEALPANCVLVSDPNLLRENGRSLLSQLRTANTIQNE